MLRGHGRCSGDTGDAQGTHVMLARNQLRMDQASSIGSPYNKNTLLSSGEIPQSHGILLGA
jgi:hypothetical protein